MPCEPALEEDHFYMSQVIRDLDESGRRSDILVPNRVSDSLSEVPDKVHTRDLLGRD